MTASEWRSSHSVPGGKRVVEAAALAVFNCFLAPASDSARDSAAVATAVDYNREPWTHIRSEVAHNSKEYQETARAHKVQYELVDHK